MWLTDKWPRPGNEINLNDEGWFVLTWKPWRHGTKYISVDVSLKNTDRYALETIRGSKFFQFQTAKDRRYVETGQGAVTSYREDSVPSTDWRPFQGTILSI